jgi:hypothetical protein
LVSGTVCAGCPELDELELDELEGVVVCAGWLAFEEPLGCCV